MKLKRKVKNYKYVIRKTEKNIFVDQFELSNKGEILIETYCIKNLDPDSPFNVFFNYIWKQSSNSKFTKKQIEKAFAKKEVSTNRSIPKIISDIGFKGQIKYAFFPIVTDKGFNFRKTLTSKDIAKDEQMDEEAVFIKELTYQNLRTIVPDFVKAHMMNVSKIKRKKSLANPLKS